MARPSCSWCRRSDVPAVRLGLVGADTLLERAFTDGIEPQQPAVGAVMPRDERLAAMGGAAILEDEQIARLQLHALNDFRIVKPLFQDPERFGACRVVRRDVRPIVTELQP